MKWYQSLYWRIAVGFVACLALLLFVQGMLFVWVVARSGRTVPNQPPDRLAQTIALDVTQAIARDSYVDIEQYIRDEYANDAQPFFVLVRGGKIIEIGGPFPQTLIQDARSVMARIENGPPFGRGFRPPPPGGFDSNGERGRPRDLPEFPERG